MTIERAGKMPNGIHRIRIDDDERIVTVLASPGWRVEVVPTVSGLTLQEVGGPVRMPMPPLIEQGVLAAVREARSFVCSELPAVGARSS